MTDPPTSEKTVGYRVGSQDGDGDDPDDDDSEKRGSPWRQSRRPYRRECDTRGLGRDDKRKGLRINGFMRAFMGKTTFAGNCDKDLNNFITTYGTGRNVLGYH